tara:strand:- start:44 stop:277 length:234 start_codon:yes stop_codon:yes gene_type:complete
MSEQLVKSICPRCDGNGFIRVPDLLGEEVDQHDCPQCDSMGELFLPEKQTFVNEYGSRESIAKKDQAQRFRESEGSI